MCVCVCVCVCGGGAFDEKWAGVRWAGGGVEICFFGPWYPKKKKTPLSSLTYSNESSDALPGCATKLVGGVVHSRFRPESEWSMLVHKIVHHQSSLNQRWSHMVNHRWKDDAARQHRALAGRKREGAVCICKTVFFGYSFNNKWTIRVEESCFILLCVDIFVCT